MTDTYWNIKLYDEEGERETIRALNVTKKDTLMRVFDRLDVYAQAMKYSSDGSEMIDSEVVNSPH